MQRDPLLVCVLLLTCSLTVRADGPAFGWRTLLDCPDPVGVAGPFAGVSDGALVVAGGANFPKSPPWDGGEKVWHDTAYVLEHLPDGQCRWQKGAPLKRPLAYGVSLTTREGVVCIGGCDAERCYADVFVLTWDKKTGKLTQNALPSLPKPCAFACGAKVGRTIYVAGGQDSMSATSAMKQFWALDLDAVQKGWRSLDPWPGPARILAVAAGQGGAFHLMTGCELVPGRDGKATRRYLKDAYRYDPEQSAWRKIADMPRPAAAAPGLAFGTSQILVFSGDDGSKVHLGLSLKDEHPGFPRDMLVYDTQTDAWTKGGGLPWGPVTTTAVEWEGRIVIPSGEDRPGHRTARVYEGTLLRTGAQATETVFVEKGVPKRVRSTGRRWQRRDGYLECGGLKNYLYARAVMAEGDFRIKARLAIQRLRGSAASFVIEGKSHFGFEGAGGEMFVQGPLLQRKTQFIGKVGDYMKPGAEFLFEVVRKGKELTFLIDGKTAYKKRYTKKTFGPFGFRPWRSTMQIKEFSAEGQTGEEPLPRTQPTTYTVQVIDLSKEKERQVIVERKEGQYLGHPTTVLLRDGKTMLCTYPLGHGGPAAVLKKSTDGGLTWSDRLPVPDNWATARNCPCIHRLTGPDGVERLFVFEGSGPMRQSVSLDEGKTWTPFEENGLRCVVAPITIVEIKGKRHLGMYHQRGQGGLTIWQSISDDGGLTWGPEKKIAQREWTDPCEPAVIRSPDGKQLLALLRENSRRYNSLMMVSNDEGETWSEMRELPASLTGDRHLARYAPDGRIVCPFRDVAIDSPTKGDFCAWVGTYDDIVNGREGQYRVRLLDSPVKGDLGYPGLELLPDGTFAATTYAVVGKGEKQSVVSVRFKMDDLDEKAKALPQQEDIFVSGEGGYHTYRIPALAVSTKGTVLAFCEGRKNSRSDTGDIDIVLRRSTDNGKTWDPMRVICDDGPNTIGNPCPVVDAETGTIWLLLTWNRGDENEKRIKDGTAKDTRRVFVSHSEDDGTTWTKPVEITKETKRPSWRWYATGPGHGIQLKSGRLLIPCDHSDHDSGGHPYRSHVIFSNDHGKTWQLGGVAGDRTNECEAVELDDGSVYLNMRSYHGRNRRAYARSTDGGETWSDVKLDNALVEPVCQAGLVACANAKDGKSRVLFSNPADTKRQWMTVRVSRDGCKTWTEGKLLFAAPSAYSDLCVTADGAIGCLYERGAKSAYQGIAFARCALDWLEDAEQTE